MWLIIVFSLFMKDEEDEGEDQQENGEVQQLYSLGNNLLLLWDF